MEEGVFSSFLLSDSDLEAKTIAGVALWWLTGAGTVTLDAGWRGADLGPGGLGPAGAPAGQLTVTQLAQSEALLRHGDIGAAVAALHRTAVLQAQADPQAEPQDEHVEGQSDQQHRGKGDGEAPNRQPLRGRTNSFW